MGKKHRPSIALIILGIILLLLYIFSGSLVELISNWSGNGTITYSYLQGNEAIVSISFDLPQKFADAMVFKPTDGWTTSLSGNTLSLTQGTLNPGSSVTIDYRLKEYVTGGTSAVTITGTTASGHQTTSQTNLYIADVFLLAIACTLTQYAFWLLILAIIVFVIMIALFIKGEKKEQEPTKQPQPQTQTQM
jgi:hypothetical protein